MPLICEKCHTEHSDNTEICSKCGGQLLEIEEDETLKFKTVLDKRYEIIEPIASGGMGTVYKANDLRLQRICAVKEMLSNYVKKEDEIYAIKRFKQEAMILASLKHDNLPSVYDYFVENGRYYLIMEYIEGYNLQTILKKQGKPGLPEKDVIVWAEEILDILMFLHSQNPPIVYRDIKPSNIVIRNSDKRAMLIDFGIARSIQPCDTEGTAIGTGGYTPMEQYRGEAEPRSDLYALGATLHCLLTGITPIPFQFQPLKVLVPQISDKLDKIVMKALEIEPSDRYESAKKMLSALCPDKGVPKTVMDIKIVDNLAKSDQEIVTKKILHPTITNEKDKSTMILIPEGNFIMGNNNGKEDEKPERELYLDAYYIDKYPVTNFQFGQFIEETGYLPKWDWRLYYTSQTIKHPVINITWNDAREYAEWAGKRLPTEAEWEKASRGTDGRIYPWGNVSMKSFCNNIDLDVKYLLEQMSKIIEKEDKFLLFFKKNIWKGTIPIGCFPDGASPYGVMDMVGSVFQWCFDWYDEDYYKISLENNPKGPVSDEKKSFLKGKVLRGSSWNREIYTTCNRSNKMPPIECGIRCVKDI